MNIMSKIKGWWKSMFLSETEKVFGIDIASDTIMDCKIAEWMNTYKGNPVWVNSEERIRSIKFAKSICSETARLTTLASGIEFDGSARANWLKEQCNKNVLPRLRNWVEYGCAVGTVVMKPTKSGVDLFLPGQFYIVNTGNGRVSDMVFQDTYEEGKDNHKKYYTKLERHSFMHGQVKNEKDGTYKDVVFYHIQNRAFVSATEKSIGKEIGLEGTKWSGLQPDVYITKANDGQINTMLFGVFKMPMANDADINSPLGVSIFSDAMEELKDLDVAYSRNAGEIKDSETIELLGNMMVNKPGTKISKMEMKLPHHVHMVSPSTDDYYQAIERPLHTDIRIQGINQQLSFIGYKCGYSNGYFVFNEKTGMVTATQVEADDRRTIQLIKDTRDALQSCLDDLFYAMSVFADIYNLAPVGQYKVSYDFGDIVYSYEEDKARHWQYVQAGKFPLWRYYMKFEGYSEAEAKALVSEAQDENKDTGLFGNEE